MESVQEVSSARLGTEVQHEVLLVGLVLDRELFCGSQDRSTGVK
jgi:hypothetical protein